jgi:hypothetical protein
MMVTVFLWTNNIYVPCKPPTHVFEGKVRQKKSGGNTRVNTVHIRIQCALLGKAERRFSTNCQQKQEMILRVKKWKIP